MRNWMANIGLLLLTVFIMLAVGEVLCRAFYREDAIYQEKLKNLLLLGSIKSSNPATYTNSITGLVHRKSDNSIDYGRYAQFNASRKKPDDAYRIAILGDSFTHGDGVTNRSDAYTAQLSGMLHETRDGKRYEILPFATGGLNTFQELQILKELALGYDPDMIILQYCSNDGSSVRKPVGDDTSDSLWVDSKTRLLASGDKVAPALPGIDDRANNFLIGNSALARFVSYKINIIRAKNDQSIDLSLNSVREMNGIARERDIPLIIIYFPLSLKGYDFCNYTVDSMLMNLTSELDISFYSMCDYADIHSIKSEIELPDQNGHYSREGYRIAAEVLKDAVEKETA